MKVWLVNPFDPLPGDPEQEGRYATLARMLGQRGHEVTWWTSSFSHRFKKPVDQSILRGTCHELGIVPQFLESPPYGRNVGLARLRNHAALARQFAARAPGADRPDLVLASSPPPGLALAAGQFARQQGVAFILDIQDLWPETFRRLAPRALRPAFGALLSLWGRPARQACRLADAIVGVGDAYAQRGVDLGGPKQYVKTFPLGVDLAAFTAAAEQGRCERFAKPPGEVWIAYTGSLNRSYDCLTAVRGFALARRQVRRPVRLFISGRGELQGQVQRIIRQEGLRDAALTGFLDFPTWAFLLSQCDVGLNASFPEAMIFLPNKIFYYLAAGLVVLNTIPGQCSRIVSQGQCGLDYRAGDAASCAAALVKVIGDDGARSVMRQAAANLARGTYDRRVLYPGYVDFLEMVRSHFVRPA